MGSRRYCSLLFFLLNQFFKVLICESCQYRISASSESIQPRNLRKSIKFQNPAEINKFLLFDINTFGIKFNSIKNERSFKKLYFYLDFPFDAIL